MTAFNIDIHFTPPVHFIQFFFVAKTKFSDQNKKSNLYRSTDISITENFI